MSEINWERIHDYYLAQDKDELVCLIVEMINDEYAQEIIDNLDEIENK